MTLEAWISIVGILITLAGMAAGFFVTFGQVLKKAGADKSEMLGKIDLLSHKVDVNNLELHRQTAAQEKTAEALFRRAESHESTLAKHGEELAVHRTKINSLQQVISQANQE